MKVGLAIGREFQGLGDSIYTTLKNAGNKPDFILFCFPTAKRIWSYKIMVWYVRIPLAIILKLFPVFILKIVLKKYTPKVDSKIYYVKDANSKKAIRILTHERPDAVIIYSCGFINKKTCELFHNILMNAHAGKLPEYRGVNNVEWAYLEDNDLFGTIQFTAPKMDTGDIVYEEHLQKMQRPKTIKQIREYMFSEVFNLFPKAISTLQEEGFRPVKQSTVRTTRYRMHPFLKSVLEKKLKISKEIT